MIPKKVHVGSGVILMNIFLPIKNYFFQKEMMNRLIAKGLYILSSIISKGQEDNLILFASIIHELYISSAAPKLKKIRIYGYI